MGKDKRKKSKRFKTGDLIVPVLGIMIFVLLSVFVYVPMIKNARVMRDEIKVAQGKEETLNKLNETLEGIDRNQMNSDYAMVVRIIPESLEVATFAAHVEKLAKENNIELQDLSASSFNYVQEDSSGVKSVSGPVTATGLYDNIIGFVNDLQSNHLYLITVGNMQLKENERGEWRVDLSVEARYIAIKQFNRVEQREVIYSPFTVYTSKSDLLDVLRSRSDESVAGFTESTETTTSSDTTQ